MSGRRSRDGHCGRAGGSRGGAPRCREHPEEQQTWQPPQPQPAAGEKLFSAGLEGLGTQPSISLSASSWSLPLLQELLFLGRLLPRGSPHPRRGGSAASRAGGVGRRFAGLVPELGLEDPQRSLPTPTMLWFCDCAGRSRRRFPGRSRVTRLPLLPVARSSAGGRSRDGSVPVPAETGKLMKTITESSKP